MIEAVLKEPERVEGDEEEGEGHGGGGGEEEAGGEEDTRHNNDGVGGGICRVLIREEVKLNLDDVAQNYTRQPKVDPSGVLPPLPSGQLPNERRDARGTNGSI